MAVLHKKEEKIQAVLGRLTKKYTDEQFVEMFIKLYSKDWGKIKSAYIKQSQDKEPGTIINMPKPEVYLKQILAIYLQQKDEPKAAEIVDELPVVEKTKKVTKKVAEKPAAEKIKAEPKKKASTVKDIEATETKKPKAAAKKTITKK
ncbi:hypothetical protein [Pedobacter sp.]|uniref:hypothetical protein n=1 Tax=Pedobacter sp. TaxID=1411316 RepID=UPI003BAC6937